MSIQTKSLNQVDYFQNFDEIEQINKIEPYTFTSRMILQCMNQHVIFEEDQFDIDGVYCPLSERLTDISPSANFSNHDTVLEDAGHLVEYVGSEMGIFDTDLKGPRSLVEFYATDRFTQFDSWNIALSKDE